MNYRALLGTVALVGGALLVTLCISTVLDAWLLRPHTTVAVTDGFVEQSVLLARIGPVLAVVNQPVHPRPKLRPLFPRDCQ